MSAVAIRLPVVMLSLYAAGHLVAVLHGPPLCFLPL
jgi:hypothetical protein